MSDVIYWPTKDPDEVDFRFAVWCDKDGTNNGGAADDGELQGATISNSAWTVPAALTKVSDDTNAVSIHGVSYGVNTVGTIKLSGGVSGQTYDLQHTVVTSDGRTLQRTFRLPVESL